MESPVLPAIIAVAAVVASFLGLRLLRWLRERRRYRYHPLAGTVADQIIHYRRIYDHLTDLSRRYKTFRVLMGLVRYEIYTCDPAVVEHILSSNFRDYGKGWYNYDNMADLLGDGIFTVDGSMWLHQRKLSSRQFSTRFLKDYSTSIFKKNASRIVDVVSEAAETGKIIDFQDLFARSTMDSIFEVAFGIELNCLTGSDKEEQQFVKAFDEASAMIMWRFVNPFWRLARFLNVGAEATLKRNISRVDDYVHKMIDKRIAQRKYEEQQRADLLSRFLQEREEQPETLTLKYLRDIILNFVIAGKDTTSGTLSWFFYVLCKHPSVQENISREVKTFAGKGDSFEEDAMEKMNYLRAALSETLRLYPAVPLDSKVCFSDDRLPDGFDVRKGEVITFQPYAMGRMKYLWGEDAEEFRPERWLDDEGVYRHESPYKFTAFQAGPRLCLGKEFAYRQMTIFAAALLRSFVFKMGDDEKPVNYKPKLTLHIDGGLGLRAYRR